VTLHKLTEKNKAFAEMLADAIDDMAERRANDRGEV
jgi:DNA-binding ferritin-like protein